MSDDIFYISGEEQSCPYRVSIVWTISSWHGVISKNNQFQKNDAAWQVLYWWYGTPQCIRWHLFAPSSRSVSFLRSSVLFFPFEVCWMSSVLSTNNEFRLSQLVTCAVYQQWMHLLPFSKPSKNYNSLTLQVNKKEIPLKKIVLN